MATIPRTPSGNAPRVHYPESDGKPLGETGLHVNATLAFFDLVGTHFAADPRLAVHADMFVYYVEGDPRSCVCPDVFVVRGVPARPHRPIYKVWEEGKAPDLVVEVTSRSTRREDTGRKFRLYQDVLRVREYYLFDPEGDYLRPPLIGYRLVEDAYLPIAPVDGRLPSEVLGLHLERDGFHIRLFDPVAGRRVPNKAERADAAIALAEERGRLAEERGRLAEEATAQLQAERRRADEEHRRAEAERVRAEEERLRTEGVLRTKEEELDRLRRELEALKRPPAGGA